MLAMLMRDHANVAALVEQMQVLLGNPDAAKQSDLNRVRWQLDRVVDRHIHALKNDVLGWLGVNKPNFVKRARGVAQMADDLRSSYTRHKERFPTGPTKQSWAEYVASASLLMRSLERLFEREKSEIFPLLQAG
jgi:hypothetical protein